MIHQLTAIFLSCVMLVVSATSQVGLHLCVCEKTVFMGECPCDEVVVEEDVASCSCCEDEGEGEVLVDEGEPCGDCDLVIVLELDDCVVSGGGDLKVAKESEEGFSFDFATNGVVALDDGWVLLEEVGGGPPLCVSDVTRPLYLRYLVFQI